MKDYQNPRQEQPPKPEAKTTTCSDGEGRASTVCCLSETPRRLTSMRALKWDRRRPVSWGDRELTLCHLGTYMQCVLLEPHKMLKSRFKYHQISSAVGWSPTPGDIDPYHAYSLIGNEFSSKIETGTATAEHALGAAQR
jgi:hypothetical protein